PVGDIVGEVAQLQVADTGCVFDDFEAAKDIALGVCQRLALLSGEDRREFLHVLANQLLVGEEDARALADGRLAPGRERGLAGGDRSGDFIGGTHRDPGDPFLGRRIDQIAPASGLRLAEFAIDEHRYAGQRGIGHGSLLVGMACGLDGAGTFTQNLYTTFTSRSKSRKWIRKPAYRFASILPVLWIL